MTQLTSYNGALETLEGTEKIQSETELSFHSKEQDLVETQKSDLHEIIEYLSSQEEKLEKQPRVSKQLVHKNLEQNVLLSYLEKFREDVIVGSVFQDKSHAFFYEHPQDHVPGMYMLEAARQFFTALAHTYYDIPLGVPLILDEMKVKFRQYAEHDCPLLIVGYLLDKVYSESALSFHKDGLSQMRNECFLVQNKKIVAEISFLCRAVDPSKYRRLREISKRKIARRKALN